MSVGIGSSIQSQLSRIIELLENKNKEGDTDGLFSRYVISKKDYSKIEWKVDCTNTKWLAENKDALIHGDYIKLASLGLSLLQNSDANAKKMFSDGFNGLTKRDPFPGDRISFVFFPRLFISITLGAKTLNDESKITWLKQIYEKRKSMGFDITQKLLYYLLEAILYNKPVYVDNSTVESFKKIDDHSIVYWASKNGLFEIHNAEKTLPILAQDIISRFSLEDLSTFDGSKIPFVFASVTDIVTESTNSIVLTSSHVSKILGNFPSGMKRWKFDENKKWLIEDEYDVQSILYLILRSYFVDIEYEDPTPKFGHGSSRLDLKIPQLKTIVEVKYARSSRDFAKIEDEIKIDASDYVQSTEYRKIIVFIYDSSSSVQDHETTKSAMKKIPNIEDVIIVSKPSHIK